MPSRIPHGHPNSWLHNSWNSNSWHSNSCWSGSRTPEPIPNSQIPAEFPGTLQEQRPSGCWDFPSPPSLDPAGSQRELAGKGGIPGISISLTPFPSPHGGLESETKGNINSMEQFPLPFPAPAWLFPQFPASGMRDPARDAGFVPGFGIYPSSRPGAPLGSTLALLVDPGKPERERDWLEFHPEPWKSSRSNSPHPSPGILG